MFNICRAPLPPSPPSPYAPPFSEYEYVAIFDADFQPDPDFLLKVLGRPAP